jgi:hypothetical protein
MFLCGGFTRLGLDADAAGNTSAAGSYGIAAASMIFLFTSTFGATWLTVPWLYPAEIFPLAVRAKGNAWGVVGWSIGNGWLVSVLIPDKRGKTDHRRLFCCPFVLPRSGKKHTISSVSPMSSASPSYGHCTRSRISGPLKRSTSCSPLTRRGTGTRKLLLLDSRQRCHKLLMVGRVIKKSLRRLPRAMRKISVLMRHERYCNRASNRLS